MSAETSASPSAQTPRGLVALLAFAAGATVANIYYCQPLLAAIGAAFRVDSGTAGSFAALTQLGYAAGILLVVPLGDQFERKRLIVATTALSAAALLAVAFAPGIHWLIAAGFLTGAISITPQLVVPYSAGVAAPERRGQTVGTVMSGLLVGILFSRTVSGFVNAHLGWRGVYGFAAGLMVLLAIWLAAALPSQWPAHTGEMSYARLLGSLLPLWGKEPVLRRHSLVGALGFGAFSAFWTTLAFHLGNLPAHYGSQTVGLFGLVGAAGALAAPISGRLSDRLDARYINGAALALAAASFGLMAAGGGRSLWLLAVGVVLMDAGVQASQISNQARIYALAPELRNRLNAFYMVVYFLGGALGSALGSWGWKHADWNGVCAVGAGLCLGGLIVLFTVGYSRRQQAAAVGGI